MCDIAQHDSNGSNRLDSSTHPSSSTPSLGSTSASPAGQSFHHKILLPSPPCSPPRLDSDTSSLVAFSSVEQASITASMLQAPSTIATAKLDISLLLKSSPSPPPSSPGEGSPRGLLSRSSSVPPPLTQYFATVSSTHRPSVSSSASVATYQEPRSARPQYPLVPQPHLPHQAPGRPHQPVLPPLATPSYQTAHHSHFNPPLPSIASPLQQQLLPSPRQSSSVKRPPPSSPHPTAPPAKRQSKWCPEEDTLIIEFRGSGMKWEEISKRLPGRSAISCRLHYQNYLERRSEWDEERKNRLARLYERLKPDMWGPLAAELGIPWRAAEAMHWQLGETDMARRAGVVPFSLAASASGGAGLSASPGSSNLPPTSAGMYPPGIPGVPGTPGVKSLPGIGVSVGETMGGGFGRSNSFAQQRGQMHRDEGDLYVGGVMGMEAPSSASGQAILPSLAELDRGVTAFDDRGRYGNRGGRRDGDPRKQ